MGIIELLLLAIGLSMDAFAVSVCKGLAMGEVKPRHMLICGAWFGGFQALMPMIGYLLGSAFENIISAVSSWIAFGLLVLIGANMIKEALSHGEENTGGQGDFSVKTMFVMAVATSIDALAVGISLAMAGSVNIFLAVALIGTVTFLLSAAGVKAGCVFGSRYEKKAQLTGGVILILLGVRILLEHLR